MGNFITYNYGGKLTKRKPTWLKNINKGGWSSNQPSELKIFYEIIFQTNAVILEPVSFELEVARNVTGALKPSDPADIKVSWNIFFFLSIGLLNSKPMVVEKLILIEFL